MWGSASPRKLERLWRIDKVDFSLAFITFLLVLALDLLPAMIAGIVLSIVYMHLSVSFPGRAVLGRVGRDGRLRGHGLAIRPAQWHNPL